MKPALKHPDCIPARQLRGRATGRMTGKGSTVLLLLALMSIAALAAVPTARAGDNSDLLTALRAKGAQIVPLGSRGGLAGYLVTPARGAGYSLYLTASGHAVTGLLYGPDGALITEDQLAAAGAADARRKASPAMSGRVEPGGSANAGIEGDVSPILPERRDGEPRRNGGCGLPSQSTGTADAETSLADTAPSDAAFSPVQPSRADLFERSAAAFGFTLGDHGPPVVLFGDALCPWSRSAVAKLGREAIVGRLKLHVVPVALLGAAAARRAAGIAASRDPAQAWFERGDRPADRAGSERIARNNALLDAWGARSVPLIVWRGPDGAIARRLGDIADAGAWLRESGLE